MPMAKPKIMPSSMELHSWCSESMQSPLPLKNSSTMGATMKALSSESPTEARMSPVSELMPMARRAANIPQQKKGSMMRNGSLPRHSAHHHATTQRKGTMKAMRPEKTKPVMAGTDLQTSSETAR